MATTNTYRSSWIKAVGYIPTPDANYLVVFTNTNTAILYKDVPSTLPGLLVAGQVDAKSGERQGERSIGATWHRLVKGKYEGQVVKDENEVNYLKEVCK